MAATLIHIKSKTLLPRPPTADDDGLDEDPREALVRPAARAPEVPGRRRAAARAGTAAQRPIDAARRARGGVGGRRLRARARSRSLQPARRVQRRWSSAPRASRAMLIPPEQISIEDRIDAAAGAAVRDRGLRLRRICSTTVTARGRPDRDLPGAAGDDPAEAGARVSARRRSATSASTSGRVRPTRARPTGGHPEGSRVRDRRARAAALDRSLQRLESRMNLDRLEPTPRRSLH